MKLESIGKNIRKFRVDRKVRQEDLAEMTNLSTAYIGMVERGEKTPSLETFLQTWYYMKYYQPDMTLRHH